MRSLCFITDVTKHNTLNNMSTMDSQERKVPTSVSVKQKVVDAIDEADELNRSGLTNKLLEDWLEEHGYL